MEKVILAFAFALAVLVGSTTNSTPDETKIRKDKYEIPIDG